MSNSEATEPQIAAFEVNVPTLRSDVDAKDAQIANITAELVSLSAAIHQNSLSIVLTIGRPTTT